MSLPMFYYPGPPFPPSLPIQPRAASANFEINSHDCTLKIRQQPKEALICQDGKEKTRKPVDPPPILQLEIRAGADPQQHFMQSPYLFMCCCLVTANEDGEERSTPSASENALAGTVVSSLHRLKDVDNHDGAFFVFGDISVKQLGQHRLRFSLFDLHKHTNEVVFLSSIVSEVFRVVAPKDFRGMEESTYLSRAFSDQGVRLRLRKEPRTVMSGSKRSFYGENQKPTPPQQPAGTVTSSTNQYQTSDYHHGTEDDARINKRPKPDPFSSSPPNSLAVRTPNWNPAIHQQQQQWSNNNGYGGWSGHGIARHTDYQGHAFSGVTGVPSYSATTGNLPPLLSPNNLPGRGYGSSGSLSNLGQRDSFGAVSMPGDYNTDSIGTGLDDFHGLTGSEHQSGIDATAEGTELKSFTDHPTPQSFTHSSDASVRGAVQTPEYMRTAYPGAYQASMSHPVNVPRSQVQAFDIFSTTAPRGNITSGFSEYNSNAPPMGRFEERCQVARVRHASQRYNAATHPQLSLSAEGNDGHIGSRHELAPPYDPQQQEQFGEPE